ncbi:MAG TPA: cupredoxin domain-containing protein, partial [Nitrososphaeraceae archaeon]|nr:cupredoxin domain-containing protein [Nitrososphaeraceae archaeon]
TGAASEAAGATLTIPEGASVQGNPSYDPDPLTVSAGDTVEVMNQDTVPHTVTSGTGLEDPESGSQFDTSIIDAGATAQIDTANLAAGDYPFYCAVHPYMVGSLKVS